MRQLAPVFACLGAFALASSVASCAGESSEIAIGRLWDEYLRSKRGQFAANAGTPSDLWTGADQAKWPMYDLAGFYLPDGAVPEVVRIAPVEPAVDDTYEVVTRFRARGDSARDSTTRPVLTMTVLARRVSGRWVLANALPHRTAAWFTGTSGRITFRVAPRLKFDSAKAFRAATFVDSLAAAFGVPAPPHIEYYVTESVDQALGILGVEVPERYGAAGGFSKPVNGQVFSGIPQLGENYRHELAHVVLLPVLRDAATSLLASEGVPTWLGGTSGRDFRASVRHLEAAMRAQPRLTLDSIIDGTSVASEIRNAAGGVLAQMLDEAGGAEAVREFLRAGWRPAAIRATLERLLHRPWSTIVSDWRISVRRLAAA